MNTVVIYWMVGTEWIRPGVSRYVKLGPYLTKTKAEEDNRYTQGHLLLKEVVVPGWFAELLADAPDDIQLWRWAKEYGFTPEHGYYSKD